MPGSPAETMVGVGAVGFGALLLYAAVKNKNPVDIVKQAVTTGSLDLSKVSGWNVASADPNAGNEFGKAVGSAAVKAAILISLENVSDPALKQDAESLMSAGQGDAGSVAQRLRDEGYPAIADAILAYFGLPTTPTGPTGGGGKVVMT